MILHISKTLDRNRIYSIEQSGSNREKTSELQYAISIMYKEIQAIAESNTERKQNGN